MTYRVLPGHLHSTADSAIQLCLSQWGISPAHVQVETPITPTIGFVTTLHATMKDHHVLCIEVADGAYTTSLDPFVLECKNDALPVRLYVATPATGSATFQVDLARAKRNGVGVIQLTEGAAIILADAISLSLSGVRHPDLKSFPARYRHALSESLSTFRSGNPSKGCSVVFDEVESLTRRIAARALKRGYWKKLPPGLSAPKMRASKDPWASIVRVLLDHFDATAASSPGLNDALLARVLGITGHRNESGHKITKPAHLRKRDTELRTRFESACDLLHDLIEAARPLRA
jgi:hypothetical protein